MADGASFLFIAGDEKPKTRKEVRRKSERDWMWGDAAGWHETVKFERGEDGDDKAKNRGNGVRDVGPAHRDRVCIGSASGDEAGGEGD
jgi:hypothetical protein